MRLGTTSYIYPADMLTNIEKIVRSAPVIRDIELLAFESAKDLSDLPTPKEIERLCELAADHDLTYTVHLPMDLRLAGPQAEIAQAVAVIKHFEAVCPVAYITHLAAEDSPDFAQWLDCSLRSVGEILTASDVCERFCVETLETHTEEMLSALASEFPCPLCVDVGHFWAMALDPLPFLRRRLERAKVIHIHGVGRRDHKSLGLMPIETLTPTAKFIQERFDGVLTIEVFNKADLMESLEVLSRLWGDAVA